MGLFSRKPKIKSPSAVIKSIEHDPVLDHLKVVVAIDGKNTVFNLRGVGSNRSEFIKTLKSKISQHREEPKIPHVDTVGIDLDSHKEE